MINKIFSLYPILWAYSLVQDRGIGLMTIDGEKSIWTTLRNLAISGFFPKITINPFGPEPRNFVLLYLISLFLIAIFLNNSNYFLYTPLAVFIHLPTGVFFSGILIIAILLTSLNMRDRIKLFIIYSFLFLISLLLAINFYLAPVLRFILLLILIFTFIKLIERSKIIYNYKDGELMKLYFFVFNITFIAFLTIYSFLNFSSSYFLQVGGSEIIFRTVTIFHISLLFTLIHGLKVVINPIYDKAKNI